MSLKNFQILQELFNNRNILIYQVKEHIQKYINFKRIADQQEYALKKVRLQSLSDKEKQNALNEERILASVIHANVIQYKKVFLEEQQQILCIVMEYADDGYLFQKVIENQKKGVLMKRYMEYTIEQFITISRQQKDLKHYMI